MITPGRYIDFNEEDLELFEDKMKKLTSELKEQMDKASQMDSQIKDNLKSIGFEI